MPTAVLLSQGDEVVTGQIVDTNAAWLADQLTGLGFDVVSHHTVGDRLPDLVRALETVCAAGDVVVCTGGLGPTDDDLTGEAAASAFGAPLRFDEVAWEQIVALYTRFGREIPQVNRKQALLPEGSLRLDNLHGTAPGFALATPQGAFFAAMPGVPHEMRAMVLDRVVPVLRDRLTLVPSRLIVIHTTGCGESALQERIGAFDRPGMVLSYRTTPGDNLVKLRAAPEVDDAVVREVVADLVARIGSPVFSIDGLGEPGGGLVEVIGRALVAQGATLALAESCTGGQIAAACTAEAGASAWLVEGVVAYANEAKTRHLGVPAALIAEHGAVSEPVAVAMAEGARRAAGATYGLATTGIAGPSGGSAEKPVGTVHLALATPQGTLHRRIQLGGGRGRVQALAVAAALDLLRRSLHDLA
jgi:nicotinamide-nucleotide amidase